MYCLGLQVSLAWAIMSALLGAYCVWYLWHCEKFRCLKYDGTRSGGFRFIMLYLYISSILTLMVFCVGLAVLKYQEGLVTVGIEGTVMPNPVEFWTPMHKRALRVLVILLSLSWAFEIIIHFSELCHWIFLFNTMLYEGIQLRSNCLHAWIVGSAVVIIYMPIVAGIGSKDVTRCQAWTFIAGSIGSLVMTLGFIPMLACFPTYTREMEVRGIDQPTLLQLFKFQELNRVRLAFRFVFIVSFLALGIDWARDIPMFTGNAFWTDLLGYCGSIGYVVSSALTLTICFPRPAAPLSMSWTGKWPTHQIIGSKVTRGSMWINQGHGVEIERLDHDKGSTSTNWHVPSLPARMPPAEQGARQTVPHSRVLAGELPPLVLEPNRRQVEPGEALEPEEPISPLQATGQKLAGVIRSLSLKRGNQ